MKLFLIVIGAGLCLLGVKEWRLGSVAASEPQPITCETLGENGPGANAHVVMGDFLLLEHAYAYAMKHGKWTEVWIPAMPLGGEYHRQLQALLEEKGEDARLPPPTDIRVVVKLPEARDQEAVHAAAQAETLQGMIVNEVDTLGSDERRLLEDSYPGIDFERCWILEAGREPKGLGLVLLMLVGGLGVAGAGVAWWISGRRATRGARDAGRP